MADVLGDQLSAGALLLGQHPIGAAALAGGVDLSGGGAYSVLRTRRGVGAAAIRRSSIGGAGGSSGGGSGNVIRRFVQTR